MSKKTNNVPKKEKQLHKFSMEGAARSIKKQLNSKAFGDWDLFKKNPVLVFQLANLYNASQVIAGKDTIFPLHYLEMGKGPSKEEYSEFLALIEENLNQPEESSDCAHNFIMIVCSLLDHISTAAGYAHNPQAPKPVQMNFDEACKQLVQLATNLINDKSVGFDESTRALASKIPTTPKSGADVAKKMREHYGIK